MYQQFDAGQRVIVAAPVDSEYAGQVFVVSGSTESGQYVYGHDPLCPARRVVLSQDVVTLTLEGIVFSQDWVKALIQAVVAAKAKSGAGTDEYMRGWQAAIDGVVADAWKRLQE